jgi:hypothetical protein
MKKTITTLAIAFCLHINAQVCFSPATNYMAIPTSANIVSTDFNSDGKLDLATADGGNISILFGTGAGNFGSVSTYSTIAGAYSICNSDFNGDGHIDLIAVSNTVTVLLGTGTGSFTTASSSFTVSGAVSGTTADFNGDGKEDLAIMYNYTTSGIAVFLGTGTGNFGTPNYFAVSGSPNDIITDDFNGDGKLDLATVNQTGGNIAILLGNGTGNFGSASYFPVAGTQLQSLTSADFNADGKKDIAVADMGASGLFVLLGTGAGNFGSAISYGGHGQVWSVISADFNDDGKLDLATANYGANNASILLGNGLGSFGSSIDFATDQYSYFAVSNDFNGDGKADLAVTNYQSSDISVLLNETFTMSITNTYNTVCSGSSTSLTANGATTYTWSANAGSATTNTVSVIVGSNTTYTVNGMIGTCVIAKTDSINIVTPTIPSICMVSTDSASNYSYNIVYWNNTYANVDSFRVYRYDPVSNSYLHIGSVSKDSLSEFKDTAFSIGGPNGGNPQYGSWQYKLAIRDTCGNISALSPYHSTIFIQENGSNFSWTSYIDSGYTTPPTGYSFLRDDNNTGNFHVLANLGHTATSTSDPNYASYPNGNWRIDALGFTCNPTYRLTGGFNNVYSTLGKSHSNTFKQEGQTTGINKLISNGQVSIYPNPANQYLYLKNINGSVNIDITDVTGQIVKSFRNTSNQIDVSDMPTGFYFLRITEISKQAIQTIKFVKE